LRLGTIACPQGESKDDPTRTIYDTDSNFFLLLLSADLGAVSFFVDVFVGRSKSLIGRKESITGRRLASEKEDDFL
jgi:hypothetical protein